MNAVTPKTMVRSMHVAQAQRAERARVARVAPRLRLAYSTKTGDAPRLSQEAYDYDYSKCRDLAKYGEHVLDYVEADLPGDRSVGYCSCGKYIDTGTFDERN